MVSSRLTERRLTIAETVSDVAAKIGRSPAQVALRWVMNRPGVTSTILGARTLEQLGDNLGALDLALDPEQTARLDAVSEIELGFPHDMVQSRRIQDFLHGGVEVEAYEP